MTVESESGTCVRCSRPVQAGRKYCPQCEIVDGCTTGSDADSVSSGPTAQDSPADPGGRGRGSLVGQVLGGTYRIVSLVGSGGMGDVYEAVHVRLKSRFAVKVLNWEDAASETGLRRFQREAMTASSIGHDNIVQVTDFKVAGDGRPFIVMEYLEGQSLRDAIRKDKRLPIKRALRIVVQVLDALDKAHSRGIVHRDLKPENVFLTARFGWPDVVKILDFGVSKFAGDRLIATHKGAFLGTPAYMPPEQIRAEETLDHRADIYAVGVLLYEMLTGVRPFVGGEVAAVVHRVVHEVPVAPRKRVPEIPTDVEEVVLKALAKAADQRFQTCAEMLEAVLKTAAGQTLDSIPGPAADSVQRRVRDGPEQEASGLASRKPSARRSRLGAAIAAVLVLSVLSAGGVFYLVRNHRVVSFRPSRSRAGAEKPAPEPGPLPAVPKTPEASAVPSVAVLAFENLTGDSTLDWLGTGIAESLAGDLAQIGSIQVLERRQVGLRLKRLAAEHRADPARVGRALGVQWVIGGNYQKAADKVRITARFHNVGGSRTLPPLKVEGSLKDIFGLQDRIVVHAADLLQIALQESDRRRLGRRTTRNLGAFRVFSMAMRACDRSWWQECFKGLDQAIHLDPRYSWAYIQRGTFRYLRGGLSRFDPSLLEAGAADLQRGSTLDPEFRPHLAVASLIHVMLGRYRTAAALINRLLSEFPDHFLVLNFAGHVYAGSVLSSLVLDDLPKGIRAYRRYLRLRIGGGWAHVNLAEKYLMAGKPEKALKEAHRARNRLQAMVNRGMAASHPPVYEIVEGFALDGLGRRDEAVSALSRGIDVLDRWGAELYYANIYRWMAHQKLAMMARASKDVGAARRHAASALELEQVLVRKHPLEPGQAYRHPLVDLMVIVDPERVVRLLRRDQKAAPRSPFPPLFLSTVHLVKGDLARAERAARRAQKLAANDPEIAPFIQRRLARLKRRESLAASLWP